MKVIAGEIKEHETYYNNHPKGIECWDVVEEFSYNLGTAIKKIWRAGCDKDHDFEQDLTEAIHYLQRELKRRTHSGS